MYDTTTRPARRLAGALAVVLAVTLASPSTLAQTADKRDVARAKQHFRAGQAAVSAGEYARAFREFEQGYALSGRALFLFNMAEAARAGGDVAEALDAYRRFLAAAPKSSLAATARSRIDELDGEAKPAPQAEPTEPTEAPQRLDPPTATEAAVEPGDSTPRPMSLAPRPQSPNRATSDGTRPLWKRWELWASIGAVALLGGGTWYLVGRDGDGPCGAGCSEFDLQ